MRIPKIACCLILGLVLASCGGKETLPRHNPMGLSGKLAPEAEAAFAKAHILWDKRDVCSDPQYAVELLDTAIRLEPEYAEAYLRRGMAKNDLHDWDGAFEDLSKSIRLNPTAEAFAFRGLVSMRSGNFIGARKDFDRSLGVRKKQHRAWNFRGALNLLEGNNTAACDDFSKGCDYGDCTGLESAIKIGHCSR